MPVPSSPRASWPRRLNGWKSCASFSGGNPAPVSLTLMRMRSGSVFVQVHDDRSLRPVVFDRVGKQVDEHLLHPGPVGVDKAGVVELGKGHADATLLRLRLHHGLAFGHDLGQRDRLRRQRHLPGLDHCARSRISLISLSRCQPAWRIWAMLSFWEGVGGGAVGLHQLGEAEDRIERAAQLMAHAGKEIRFREVGFLRRRLGALQLDVLSCSACSKRLRSVTSRAAANTPCSFRSRS